MTMTPEQVKEMNQALVELRKTVEAKDADSAASKEKVAKLEKSLDALEAKNAELTKAQADERKAALEMKERADELEKKLSRMPAGTEEKEKVAAELKAFETLAAKGPQGIAAEQKAYLRTDNDVEGGYLAPPEYVAEILKKITEISPVRQYARVRKTARGEIEIPKRNVLLSGAFRGEGGQIQTSISNYGMAKVPAHFLDVIVPVTTAMLTDAAFNMETEINADVIEAFALIEGQKFLNGVLPTEPEGILSPQAAAAGVQTLNSGIANDITADNFFDLIGSLKRGYDPMFMLNRRTLARVRKMKDGVGAYLFAPAAEGAPATIGGLPYAIGNDVPDISAGQSPVICGDFLRGYTIVDGLALTMIRDPYSLADQGKVRFVFSKRVGGKVVMGEAIAALKCST